MAGFPRATGQPSPAWGQPRTALAAAWRREWLVVLLLAGLASFLLFWRLAEPPKYIYDEVYHSFTANLMTRNDPRVYQWWNSAQPNPIPGVEYEWTHPPLAKLIIAGGIKLWGNNSWGWRFFSALWGVFSVVLIYTLARQLFRDRSIALLAGLFLLTDGLMFSEARIGTNDIFQLAFLLAAYNAFVLYLHRQARHGLGLLALTGLLLGLAFASKWPAVFSIGLLAAIALVRGFWPHRDPALAATLQAGLTEPAANGALDSGLATDEPEQAHQASDSANDPGALGAGPDGAPDHGSAFAAVANSQGAARASVPDEATAMGQSHVDDGIGGTPAGRAPEVGASGEVTWRGFAPWEVPARLWYLVAAVCSLVLLPIGLYILSYLQMYLQPHHIPADYAQIGPFHIGALTLGPATLTSSSWWNMFVGEQWQMWHYHTTLKDHHPYYSLWWQWLLDIRPVFYYVNRAGDTVANTYALGNPILYWVFPLGIVAGAILVWRRRRQAWLALVLGAFAVNWLPWIHSPRGLFFYHFLPSVPFLVMLMAHGVVALHRRPEVLWRRIAIAYTAAVFLGFAFFYTQLSAWPVPGWWADLHYWLPSWQ